MNEQTLLEMQQKLYEQQQQLLDILQQLSNQIKPANHHIQTPSIDTVLKRFIIKNGENREITHRKYNIITKYIIESGLTVKDKYAKFHTEANLLNIMDKITKRSDLKGDQKVRHARWIIEFVKFAVFAYPDTYKTDVLVCLPEINGTKKSEKEPHCPYTEEQLKQIFNPEYEFFYKNPDFFWGCLISLFTGSRRNAAFSLQYKDIFQKDDMWCINFIEDCPGIKKLKTEDSERIVPIHSTMINMGFIKYIQKKQKKLHATNTDFIFKNIVLSSVGTLNTHMSRNFFLFLKRIGIKTRCQSRYDFHSFRKNANITMEKCGIIRSYIDKIIGWKSKGSEGERSYSNYTIQQISEQLELLKYPYLESEFKQWKKIMSKL